MKSRPRLGLPGLDLLVDEHEEEESVNGRTVRHRGIYLPAQPVYHGGAIRGFYAIIAAMRGNYEAAPMAIFVAMVFDGLDGRGARLTNTSSKFGAEYDSLSDMVSFGVAPALVVFSWALGIWGNSAGASRSSMSPVRRCAWRVYTQIDSADKAYFTGLASPAAANVIASAVWVCHDAGLGEALPYELAIAVGLLTVLSAF